MVSYPELKRAYAAAGRCKQLCWGNWVTRNRFANKALLLQRNDQRNPSPRHLNKAVAASEAGCQYEIFSMRPSLVSFKTVTRFVFVSTRAVVLAVSMRMMRCGYFRILRRAKNFPISGMGWMSMT